VNLSSIRARKMGNPRRDEKPEPYAREAKEFLRQRLVGQQVRCRPACLALPLPPFCYLAPVLEGTPTGGQGGFVLCVFPAALAEGRRPFLSMLAL